MSNAKIGFSTSPSFISKIIQTFSQGKSSHTYFTFHDETLNLDVVMEEAWLGFRIIPYDKWLQTNEVIYEHLIPDQAIQYAATHLGESYDYQGLFGMATVIVAKWFKAKWNNPTQSASASFCSEMAVRTLQHIGMWQVKDINPSNTSPTELEAIMRNS